MLVMGICPPNQNMVVARWSYAHGSRPLCIWGRWLLPYARLLRIDPATFVDI